MAGPRQTNRGGMVPMMVMVTEQQHAVMLAGVVPEASRLGAVYDEAMAQFDAFCFWYARPPRSAAGLREIARRLETYGSPEALRIAGEVRTVLAGG